MIGIEVTGLPQVDVDRAKLRDFLSRRSSRAPRKEPDEAVFRWDKNEAGCDRLTVTIANVDQRSEDYADFKTVPRPGHADFVSYIKDGRIPPGGGRWSGRLTAPLCAAGFVALELLRAKGISISAKVVSAAACEDERDSFGAVVEVVATGVNAGLGDAGCEGLESKLSAAFFGIPAVKGVEFGEGFRLAAMTGSEANDAYYPDPKGLCGVTMKTNRCGGIIGGVSTGFPIVARLAFKPTPSIALDQDSVDLATGKAVKITVKGRHDRCVAYRACPAVESAMALVLYGLISDEKE